MRPASLLGVLCILAVPALGDPITYTFDVTAGLLTWQQQFGSSCATSTAGGLTGTFAVTIYQGDGHIDECDTFILEDANLVNTDHLAQAFGESGTANLYPYQVDYWTRIARPTYPSVDGA